ncbi:hypothetical protein [Paenibacillus sambharensis]|uniref:hypothetical protein n=1 Tax=Paenibacillus sambharensis TaxID=1803190 RepID=UPI0015E8D172|nr:hypothetical protein [Paenibacillus sambharensis]
MLNVYAAEMQMKEQKQQLDSVTRLAWKWFGKQSFCVRCLFGERNKEISVD